MSSVPAEHGIARARSLRGRRRHPAGRTSDLAVVLLLVLAAQLSVTALASPFHRMFEGGGVFFSGIAKTHLERGLGFTKGQDWIRNADNPYDWAGDDPDEARPYAHHPPGLGLALAALFALLGASPTVARLGTVAMHLSGLLLLVVTVRRFAEPRRPFAAWFTGLFAALAPVAGFFGRHVCHEAWVTPGLLLAVAAYLPRLERGGDGTAREDAAVCAGVTVAACFGWPAFYLPPLLVGLEGLRGRLFGRLSRWLSLGSAVVFVLLLGQIGWAVGGAGLDMLADGASKRISPGTYGLALGQWVQKVGSFAQDDFTTALLLVAVATIAVAACRALFRLRTSGPASRLDPIAVWIGLWLALGGLHVVAFPSGSFVHPYWLWYLLPGVATAGGVALAWLWRRRSLAATVFGRAIALLLLVAFACESRATLVSWFDVERFSTGNPLLDRPLPAPVQTVCSWCVPPRLSDLGP